MHMLVMLRSVMLSCHWLLLLQAQAGPLRRSRPFVSLQLDQSLLSNRNHRSLCQSPPSSAAGQRSSIYCVRLTSTCWSRGVEIRSRISWAIRSPGFTMIRSAT